MMNKDQTRERWLAVRQILMTEWDPIGVNDVPEAADEYDGYLGDVCELLDRKASVETISNYLLRIETQNMGLGDLKGISLVPSATREHAAMSLFSLPRKEG